MLNIHISRIDNTVDMPEYHTSGAVGFDLTSRLETIIPAQSYALVPNNIVVKVPEGYMLAILSRSSTLKKKGLMIGNAVGVIDQDYYGPNDEVHTLFYNPSDKDIVVARGERWSQAVFVRVEKATFVETTLDATVRDRGGFGSTGTGS